MSEKELTQRTDFMHKVTLAWTIIGLPKKVIESMQPINSVEELKTFWDTNGYPKNLFNALRDEVECEHVKRSKIELANHICKFGQN